MQTTTYHCIYLALFLLMGTYSHSALALDCLSNPATGTGNWSDPATWTSCGTTYPQQHDTATVRNAHTVTVNGTFTVASVTVTASANNNTTTRLDVASGQALTVTGALAINGGAGNRKAEVRIGAGTLTVGTNLTPTTAAAGNVLVTFTGAGTLNIGGDFGASATFEPSTGTVTYNGSGAQSVATHNYYNLTINKPGGTATTGGNITIGNNLTLSAGTLDIGINSIDRGAVGGALALADGTTLRIASAFFPANYAAQTIDSTVEYTGSANINVPAKAYGNLLLSGSANRSLPALTIAGSLTTIGTVATSAGGNLTINGTEINIGSGTSFNASTFSHTINGNFVNAGTFTRGTSTFTFSGAGAQSISNAATFHHLVTSNTTGSVTPGATLSISGNFTNTTGFTAGSSTVTFNGTAAQSLTGATTFHNLTMNNTAGLTLSDSNVTIRDTLTFTNGKITTGITTSPEPYPYKLIITSVCGGTNKVVNAGQTTGWVVGNLQKAVPAGLSTCTFQVGGTANYSPIVVEFPDTTTAGNLTGAAMPYTVSPTGHPKITETDINPARNVNRFWTLKDNTVGFTSYNATFHFNAADIDSGADPLEFVIRRYNPPWPSTMSAPSNPPSSWSNVTVDEAALTSTSSRGTGITGIGDFAIGNSTVSAFLREREWVYQRELYYQ